MPRRMAAVTPKPESMDLLLSLNEALPWYLQPTGSARLSEILAEWGAARGIVRDDDWTQVLLWIFQWLTVGALAWGLLAGLRVVTRSPKGRFRGDREKYRDAVITAVLRAAAGAAIAAVIVLLLLVVAAVGPGPFVWIAAVYAAARLGRSLFRLRERRRRTRSSGRVGHRSDGTRRVAR